MPLSSDVFVKQAWRPWVGLPFVYGDGDEHLAAVPTIVARMKWHPAQTFSLARQRDVARAFELALTGVMDGRIVNIADDAPSTLYDMALAVGVTIEPSAEPLKKPWWGRADGTLALSLGFKPTVPTLLQAVQQGILNKPSLAEIRRDLAEKIAAHTPARGENVTAVQGLSLFRQTACTPCYMASVEPSVSVFVQGRKRINIGGVEYLCDESSFLVASIDAPVQSQIIEASEAVPQLAMRLKLDMQMVREVVSREDLFEPAGPTERRGLAVGHTTAELVSAAARLIDLLDTPQDIPFLGHLIEREIIYRIFQTPQGEKLRAIATSGNLSQRAAKAIAWLSTNYAKPLRMEELAEIARMGVSTLHHQFRALTAMSPLQYQKHLRFRVARERMLKDGIDAPSAAYEVGYESLSQFNREYSRFFGQPPMRDIKALRETKVVAIDAA